MSPVQNDDPEKSFLTTCLWLKTAGDGDLRSFQPDALLEVLSEAEVCSAGVAEELCLLLRELCDIDLRHIRIQLYYDEQVRTFAVARGSLWTVHMRKDQFIDEVFLISSAGSGRFNPN
ncbi:hypothetical protein [Rhizobium sp. BK176]|uniref:hypothetical protein n=1 Tax=Rhizobium sp. BK176 TaxID=2587071 RepID=UPI002169F003|nr:hypothetical protein [Rhizobium sp. BK176]MCS4091358.1 hypothetical protein [Rhizobium sp. BK176]